MPIDGSKTIARLVDQRGYAKSFSPADVREITQAVNADQKLSVKERIALLTAFDIVPAGQSPGVKKLFALAMKGIETVDGWKKLTRPQRAELLEKALVEAGPRAGIHVKEAGLWDPGMVSTDLRLGAANKPVADALTAMEKDTDQLAFDAGVKPNEVGHSYWVDVVRHKNPKTNANEVYGFRLTTETMAKVWDEGHPRQATFSESNWFDAEGKPLTTNAAQRDVPDVGAGAVDLDLVGGDDLGGDDFGDDV